MCLPVEKAAGQRLQHGVDDLAAVVVEWPFQPAIEEAATGDQARFERRNQKW